MALTSPRFVSSPRMQKASTNSPPFRKGEIGDGVSLLQQSLIDLGYKMPISVKKLGVPDGIYGNETWATVYQFQSDQTLSKDGIAGKDTVHRLDKLLNQPKPPKVNPYNYDVPGIFDIIAQPSGMTCWAAVGTMMIGWRDQKCYTIETAMSMAGKKWRDMFDKGQGLPAADHGPFCYACGMVYEGLACYPVESWLAMLKTYGPLAVVTANPYHARIMVGMRDSGTPDGTEVVLIDPAGGRKYHQNFGAFTKDFEDVANSPRYQIWHYGPLGMGL